MKSSENSNRTPKLFFFLYRCESRGRAIKKSPKVEVAYFIAKTENTEEGVYSGNADTTDGTYLPILAVGGNGLSIPSAEFPHVGPWNTFEEPPW